MEQTLRTTAAERYAALETDREPYLTRAYDVAEVTIPFILPRKGTNSTSTLPTPHQGFGAQCITNLAEKTSKAAFPLTQPFLRYKLTPETQAELGARPEEERTAILGAMALREQRFAEAFELTNHRPVHKQAFLHLFVVGNGCVHLTENGRFKFFPLTKYVVKRGADGEVIEAIILEEMSYASLPEVVRTAYEKGGGVKDRQAKAKVYTHMILEDGRFRVYQEVQGEVIEGSEGAFIQEELPFFFLRDIVLDGEDYGRSRGELYLGDFIAVEKLSAAMLDGAAIGSRVWLGVKPGAVCRAADLNKAGNGAAVLANPDDVFEIAFKGVQGSNEVVRVSLTDVINRLSRVFLLNSSVTRDAERVTAEEIRYLAVELEEAQAGLYATIANEYQSRLARVFDKMLTRKKRLPALDKRSAEPLLVTGLDALGRGFELNKLMSFANIVGGLPTAQTDVNWSNLLNDIALNMGFSDPGRYVKSPEQKQQDMMQQIMAQSMAAAGQTGGAALAANAAEDPEQALNTLEQA